jgi:sulfoxide reductase heme-binding subunit YedZ
MIGLFAFAYGSIHLITYSIFDKSLNIPEIISDVWQRPFIAFGMAAFTMLIPLAITSTNAWIKRIGGKNWQRLHRLTYFAATAGIIHFFMIQKSDYFYPIIFGIALASLLGYRIYKSKFVTK